MGDDDDLIWVLFEVSFKIPRAQIWIVICKPNNSPRITSDSKYVYLGYHLINKHINKLSLNSALKVIFRHHCYTPAHNKKYVYKLLYIVLCIWAWIAFYMRQIKYVYLVVGSIKFLTRQSLGEFLFLLFIFFLLPFAY